jgi:hypothetical protein
MAATTRSTAKAPWLGEDAGREETWRGRRRAWRLEHDKLFTTYIFEIVPMHINQCLRLE